MLVALRAQMVQDNFLESLLLFGTLNFDHY